MAGQAPGPRFEYTLTVAQPAQHGMRLAKGAPSAPDFPRYHVATGCALGRRSGRSPSHQQLGTAFETHNGRSALAARIALHTPYLPLVIPVGSGSVGWEAIVRCPPLTHFTD